MKAKMNEILHRIQLKLRNCNGFDELGRDVFLLSFFLSFIDLFIKSSLLSWISMFTYFYFLFRVFSTNKGKRRKENQDYLRMRWQMKNRFQERKTYKYLKCPGCGQKLRVPRKQGKIEVHCPKCDARFDARS